MFEGSVLVALLFLVIDVDEETGSFADSLLTSLEIGLVSTLEVDSVDASGMSCFRLWRMIVKKSNFVKEMNKLKTL